MTDFAQAERRGLCDLLASVGPHAPTLCDGWDTGDLIAHLWVRENTLAAIGIVVPGLSRLTTKAMQRAKAEHDFDELVALVRSGPRAPLRPIDEAMNHVEFFIHHEDVRRAAPGGAKPRVLGRSNDEALWAKIPTFSKLALRTVVPGVIVRRVDGGMTTDEQRIISTGPDPVTVTGEPGEILLWLYGRGEVASLEFSGPQASVEAVRRAGMSI